jgi:hypothetical protein
MTDKEYEKFNEMASRFKFEIIASFRIEKEAVTAAEHRAALFNMQRVMGKIISEM